MLEFIGFVCVTGVLLYITLSYLYMMFLSVAFAGWESLKDGIVYSLVIGGVIALGWWGWWVFLGSGVDISFNASV